MSWVPTDKETASVIAADGRHRYEYFIHRVCETKAVWGLYKDDGWASVGQDTGETILPFWPHEVFARAFISGPWEGFTPRRIELHEFLDAWIPGLRQNGIQPAIFPVAAGSSILVTLDDLDANLRHELAEVYGEEDGPGETLKR